MLGNKFKKEMGFIRNVSVDFENEFGNKVRCEEQR